MNKINEALFKQAINEGFSKRIDSVIESYTEPIVCSKRHKAAMKRILNGKIKNTGPSSLKMKKIIAILVAAVLLLASCAIACRHEIRDFIEEIYESFVKVNYNEGEDKGAEIEDVYELTYVPEGYSLCDTLSVFSFHKTVFSNTTNEKIVFEQRALDTVNFYADIENEGYKEIVDISIYKIYYKETEYHSYYMWNDGKYTIRLISDVNISTSDLISIIQGIKIK